MTELLNNGSMHAGDCCELLKQALTQYCTDHSDPYDCPDRLLVRIPKFDEVQIVIHDGGRSGVRIHFCPWCGSKLPESKRDRWFNELESLGIDPAVDGIPSDYENDAWYRTEDS